MSRAKRVLLAAAAAVLLFAAAGFAWVWFAPCSLGGCAPLEDLAKIEMESSTLLDLQGFPFAQLEGVNRRIVPLDSLPPFVPQAFIAIEDRRFYKHRGVDFRRVVGALVGNLTSGRIVAGGSTITQQLARNLFPGTLPPTERSLRRKVLEARVARQIERTLPKDSILELYLNQIYLGNGAYGVEAATSLYFGKRAAELTLAEAATLAAIPQSPSQVNPFDDVEGAKARRDLVLDEMMRQGYIGADAHRLARAEPMRVMVTHETAGIGPYFVDAVRRELEEIVGDRLYTAGLRIHTTLDQTIQRIAEEELQRQLTAIEGGEYGPYAPPELPPGADASDGSRELQGSVVVIDATSGEVRALVGGRSYAESQFNRATRALRQPGSAFKPFIYAVALERFHSPAHLIDNSRLTVRLGGGEVWQPRNMGDDYRTPITMRDALAVSSNTATVRLAQEIGLDKAIELAHDLGVSSEIEELPSVALGAVEVRPIELIAAYAAFANGGVRIRPHLIRQIVDRSGQIVWQVDHPRARVIDPDVAFVLTSMLEDAVDRGTGVAVREAGYHGAAAGKTGTTNKGTDAWFIGYTPELVAGIWIGHDYPRPILSDASASGEIIAAPTWGRIMRRIYENRPAPLGWEIPEGVTVVQVERKTSAIVTPDCPAAGTLDTDYFIGEPPVRECPGAAPRPLRAATLPDPIEVVEATVKPDSPEVRAVPGAAADTMKTSTESRATPRDDTRSGQMAPRNPSAETEPAVGEPARERSRPADPQPPPRPSPPPSPQRAPSPAPRSAEPDVIGEPAPELPPVIGTPTDTAAPPDSLDARVFTDSVRSPPPAQQSF